MSLTNVWARLMRRPVGPCRQKPHRTLALHRRWFLPGLEVLEDRTVLSILTVTSRADSGDGSLRALIAAAQSGDQIIFDDGLQGQTITLTSGELVLTKSLDIEGPGAGQLAISGNHASRVFNISGAATVVTVAGLTITDGLAKSVRFVDQSEGLGGGVFNNGGNITLDHVVLQNNVARGADAEFLPWAGHNARGGGLYSMGGSLDISSSTIANNQAIGGSGAHADVYNVPGSDGGSGLGGGLYATGASIDIADSTLANNQGQGGQGGDGIVVATSSGYAIIPGGTGGAAQGGGLYVNGGSLTIATSTIASDQAAGGSAGAFGYLGGAAQGGGLYANGASLMIATSTIAFDHAAGGPGGAFGYPGVGEGGGLYTALGTLTLSNSILSGNTVIGSGGGISNYGTLTLSNSTVSGNSILGGSAGGIDNSGTLTLSNSTVSGNSGVGIVNAGTLTLSNSTVSDNSSGGIGNWGTLTVSNSTLSGNSWLGGIFNEGTLTVSNTTLSGNYANSPGGGIYTRTTRPVTLTNVTLTANRAQTGGGLYVFGGSIAPLLHNTLIAGNFRGATGTTRDDVSGALNPGGDYNLIGDGTGMTGISHGVNGNLVGSAAAPIDPLLGPLQDNGGPTQTMALRPGSPARPR